MYGNLQCSLQSQTIHIITGLLIESLLDNLFVFVSNVCCCRYLISPSEHIQTQTNYLNFQLTRDLRRPCNAIEILGMIIPRASLMRFLLAF